ncbi:LysR family transcriptional regulator [Pontibacterium granulatum]|uniref:LysR family transcriptional regulator n=1 Tax=Pontibacterium granulatum TaxID=2036029 RepID=UPI00249A2DF8|nr:LysR family transcriptional regulator [Pontibacterium granulatum]MDI3325771.1 LysR family transcriptional regulator [Pontibacterium granulatum]
MEIVGLKTFKAVVDEGGIKGASEKLHTVQSNITSRIQKLEEELDAKLFGITGRKLELTPTGQLLYRYAQEILQLEQQAASAIRLSKGSYDLRVGTPETFAAVHLPRALKALKQAYPQIRPKIHTATSAELVIAVQNNKVDCAVVGNVTPHESIRSVPIVDESLVVVTPQDGEYEQVLCVREEGCAYRKCAEAWQQQAGRSDDQKLVMSSADGVLGCIAGGLGYTVISENMVIGSRYEKDLLMEKVSHGDEYVHVSMIYRKDNPLEEGIQQLIEMFPAKIS